MTNDKALQNIPLMSIVTQIGETPTSQLTGICSLRDYQQKLKKERSDLIIHLKDEEEPIRLRYRENQTVFVNDHR